jgi:protein-S-isoprenylcysteine O-methyltransferase Ste14
MILRHLLSIAVLPFTMTVVVPIWIARAYGVVPAIGGSSGAIAIQVAGLLLLVPGIALFVWSLRRFADDGQGTLAPWDPPKHLVIRGPYRYVRNPMISGVVFVLFAQAMVLRSVPHLLWALSFLGINLTFIPLVEEPQLEQRFGDDYREYCRRVPRLFPSLRPKA